MSDITTVETVEAGGYTVRVAHTDDGTAWEAVVVSEEVSSGSSSSPMTTAHMLTFSPSSDSSDDSDTDDAPIGTPATAPHKWVAVGFAIERYEWRQVGEETADVADGYATFIEDADLSTSERDGALHGRGIRASAIGDEYSGSFDINASDIEDDKLFQFLMSSALGGEGRGDDD